MNAIKHTYKGFDIEFEVLDGAVMANATKMCQAFGKRPIDWLRLPQTNRYIDAVKVKCENLTSLVDTRRGNFSSSSQGTWIHEKLILKLAQWLDVDFEIWCDERVAELIKEKQSKAEIVSISRKQLAQMVLDAEFEKERLQAENEKLSKKAEYTDKVLLSESEITTTIIAKELGMSATALNRLLNQMNVLYRHGDSWVLYSKYHNKGYTKTRTHQHISNDGKVITTIYTVWTEKGRMFIHTLFKGNALMHQPRSPIGSKA